MIIELGNIHAKWKLLRENIYATSEWECDHLDRNMVRSVRACYKQGGNQLYGKGRRCKARVERDGDHETNNVEQTL
jgi:hypothetical protein